MPLDPPPTLLCSAGELGPVVANVSDPRWQNIAPVLLRETVSGHAPGQATSVRAAVDGLHLRVLFDCADALPWATLRQPDEPLYTEEVVEVFLDPVGDLECYFEIELNPLNAVLDLVLRQSPSGLRKDFAWRCEGLQTAVAKTAGGWAAELAIPFESLMPGARQRLSWRANFLRIDRTAPGASAELSAWSPTGLRQFHVPHRFGHLHLPSE